jgi:hypothetical protein
LPPETAQLPLEIGQLKENDCQLTEKTTAIAPKSLVDCEKVCYANIDKI